MTTDARHTPDPWLIKRIEKHPYGWSLYSKASGDVVLQFDLCASTSSDKTFDEAFSAVHFQHGERREQAASANARQLATLSRIQAAVNFCAGIPTESLEGASLADALKEARAALEAITQIKWGYDGDCGAIAIAEEALAKLDAIGGA